MPISYHLLWRRADGRNANLIIFNILTLVNSFDTMSNFGVSVRMPIEFFTQLADWVKNVWGIFPDLPSWSPFRRENDIRKRSHGSGENLVFIAEICNTTFEMNENGETLEELHVTFNIDSDIETSEGVMLFSSFWIFTQNWPNYQTKDNLVLNYWISKFLLYLSIMFLQLKLHVH